MQVRHGGFHHPHERKKVDLKRVFELLVGQLGHIGACKLLGGVAHHDVELAQLLHGLDHDMLAKGRVAQVAGQQQAAATFLLH